MSKLNMELNKELSEGMQGRARWPMRERMPWAESTGRPGVAPRLPAGRWLLFSATGDRSPMVPGRGGGGPALLTG